MVTKQMKDLVRFRVSKGHVQNVLEKLEDNKIVRDIQEEGRIYTPVHDKLLQLERALKKALHECNYDNREYNKFDFGSIDEREIELLEKRLKIEEAVGNVPYRSSKSPKELDQKVYEAVIMATRKKPHHENDDSELAQILGLKTHLHCGGIPGGFDMDWQNVAKKDLIKVLRPVIDVITDKSKRDAAFKKIWQEKDRAAYKDFKKDNDQAKEFKAEIRKLKPKLEAALELIEQYEQEISGNRKTAVDPEKVAGSRKRINER